MRVSETFYLYKTTDSLALVLTNAVRRIEMEPGSPATIKGFDCHGMELWRDDFALGRVTLTATPNGRRTYQISGADCAVQSDTVWLNTTLLCPLDSVLYTFTERATGDVGYFNLADSLYYWKAVKEIVYSGALNSEGNCIMTERMVKYEEPHSVKLLINWLGPDGPSSLGYIYGALVIQTSVVPYYSFPYRMLVQWDGVSNQYNPNAGTSDIGYEVGSDALTYFSFDVRKTYNAYLYKGPVRTGQTRRCTEVSVSTTPEFDENAIIIENASENDQFTSPHPFRYDSIIQAGKKYIVIREKTCAPSGARVGTSEEYFDSLDSLMPIIQRPTEPDERKKH